MPRKYKPRKHMPLHENIGEMMKAATPKKVKKVVKALASAPKKAGKLLKKKWDVNQAYRNKNDTYEKFMQNNKFQ